MHAILLVVCLQKHPGFTIHHAAHEGADLRYMSERFSTLSLRATGEEVLSSSYAASWLAYKDSRQEGASSYCTFSDMNL